MIRVITVIGMMRNITVFGKIILVTTVTTGNSVLFQAGLLFNIENTKVDCLFKDNSEFV